MRLTDKRILFFAIAAYFVVFGILTSLRHYNFETQAWDLAAFVQTMWNTTQGRVMFNNLEQVSNHLGLHMSPWLFALVPGYAVFPTPYFLLIAQTLALALGAWPLYLLAQKVIGRKSWSLLAVAAYLLYPSLHWSNFYDFHEITFFIPLFLAAFYLAETKRWGWAGLFFVLAASTKEDAILAVAFAGLYFLFFQKTTLVAAKSRKIGLAMVLLSILYLVIAVKLIMPALGGGVLRFDRYANFGATPMEAIKTAVTNPFLVAQTVFTGEKFLYLLILLLPVAFLPFFSWRTLILLLPGLPENLLTNYTFQFSGLYHYDSILIPAIFIGTIFGARNFLDWKPRWERYLFWILVAVTAIGFFTRSPINFKNFPLHYFQTSAQEDAYHKLVALVPPGISVAATTNLVPHLSHREHAYALGVEKMVVDMVIADLADTFGFKNAEEMDQYLESYLKSGIYQSRLFGDRYLIIFRQGLKLVEAQ